MAGRVSSPVIVGREAELAALAAALERARSGEPSLVLLSADAGIGKTRLIEEFAAIARDGGSTVLLGGCPPLAGRTLAYGAVIEALRSLAREAGDPGHLLLAAEGDGSWIIAALLRGGPMSRSGLPPEGTTSLYVEILGLLRDLGASGAPPVLALEDLHWADPSTVDLLSFLGRNLPGTPAVVMGSFRAEELEPGDRLLAIVNELERAGLASRVELAPLARPEVGRLIEAIRGERPDRAQLDTFFGRSGGNPFFVEEMLGAAEPADLASMPPSLRDILLTRVAELSDQAQVVLRWASVAGRPVTEELLASVTRLSERALTAALREAVRHHVLAPAHDGTDFVFRHTLLREAIYADLLPGERIRSHRALAEALDAGVARPAAPAAERAFHWLAARDPGRALPALLAAGQEAEAIYAFSEATDQYGRGIEHWAAHAGMSPALPLDRAGLLKRAALCAGLAGEPDLAIAWTEEAIGEAEDPAIQSELLERLGRYRAEAGQLDTALDALERAVARAPTDGSNQTRARSLGTLARVLAGASRHREAAERARQAIEAARAAGADAIEAEAHETLGVAHAATGRIDEALAELGEARRLAGELAARRAVGARPSRVTGIIRGFASTATILERAGRSAESARIAIEGGELARKLGVEATWGTVLQSSAGAGLARLGRWDEAESLSLDVLERGGRGAAAMTAHVTRARVRLLRGDPETAQEHLAVLGHIVGRRDARQQASEAIVRAELAMGKARFLEARRTVAEGLRQLDGQEDEIVAGDLLATGLRVEAELTERARARRDRASVADALAASASLIAQVRALVALFGAPGTLPRDLRAIPLLAEAEVARVEGRADPDAWAAAAGAFESLGEPYPAGYARLHQAEALLAARGDRDGAAASLRAAHEAATALGAGPWSARSRDSRCAPASTFRTGPRSPPLWPPRLRQPRTRTASPHANTRCWPCWLSGGRTARLPRNCSSARRQPVSMSRTSWASSGWPAGSRRPRSPTVSASSRESAWTTDRTSRCAASQGRWPAEGLERPLGTSGRGRPKYGIGAHVA